MSRRFYVETDISKVPKEQRAAVAKAIMALKDIEGLGWIVHEKVDNKLVTYDEDVRFEESPFEYCTSDDRSV